MSRRARTITAVVLLVAAAASAAFAASLVQVADGNLRTTVMSRVPDWSTDAASIVVALGVAAVAALVAAVVVLPKRAKASSRS